MRMQICLAIAIKRYSNIFSFSVSQQDLAEQCKPVFSRYQFCGQERTDTEGIPHDKHVEWNHTHVILLGILQNLESLVTCFVRTFVFFGKTHVVPRSNSVHKKH